MFGARNKCYLSAAQRIFLEQTREASNYFTSKTQKMVPIPSQRPSNQDGLAVQRKSAEALRNNLEKAKIPKITKKFLAGVDNGTKLSKMFGDGGLHMAHGVSAKALATLQADMINLARRAPNRKEQARILADLDEWVTGHISSDAEGEDKQELKDNIRTAVQSARWKVATAAASRALLRLNRSSRNLTGGHGKTNSRIGPHQDEPRDTAGVPFPHMAKRMNAFWDLVGKYNLNSKGGYNQFLPMIDDNGEQVRSTLPDA